MRFAKSVLAAAVGRRASRAEAILGVLSLIFWALILIVTVKYVLILLRADNNGEGGTLALMALAQRAGRATRLVVLALGMIGAALFYGDAMITPALSVLSAVEGLKVAAPQLPAFVLPLTSSSWSPCSRSSRAARRGSRPSSGRSPASGSWPSPSPASATSSRSRACSRAINPVYGVSFLFNHGLSAS